MTTLNKLNNIYLAKRTKLKSSVTRKQKNNFLRRKEKLTYQSQVPRATPSHTSRHILPHFAISLLFFVSPLPLLFPSFWTVFPLSLAHSDPVNPRLTEVGALHI